MPVFGQDPERYLKELEITLASFLDPEMPAVLDSSHRSLVNHDAFFFGNLLQKEAFDRNPLQYLDAVRDPVSMSRFRPTRDSPNLKRTDRVFYFKSDSTQALFAAMPDSFTTPKYRMLPKESP